MRCVRIAYHPRLDTIREKFNQIVDDRENIDGNFSEEAATALNDIGTSKIGKLTEELRQLESMICRLLPFKTSFCSRSNGCFIVIAAIQTSDDRPIACK